MDNDLNTMPDAAPNKAPSVTPEPTPTPEPETPLEPGISASETPLEPRASALETPTPKIPETPTPDPVSSPVIPAEPAIDPNFPGQAPSGLATPSTKPNNKRTIVVAIIGLIIIIALAIVTMMLTSGQLSGQNKVVNDNPTVSPTYSDPIEEEPSDIESDNTPTDANVSSDWTSYSFSINGETMTLPLKFSELSRISGLTMKESAGANTISPNYVSLVNLYKDDKVNLHIEVTNNSEGSLRLDECDVVRVTQTNYHVEKGDTKVIFPGNLTAGMEMTEEQLFSILGTTNNVIHHNEGTDAANDVYTYAENDMWITEDMYKITIKNGVIDELVLDNKN